MTPEHLNLSTTLLATVSDPDRVALHEPTRSWTFGELASNVVRVGGALLDLGVGKGDRVAVLLPDSLEAVASILGTIHIGAIAVPLSELGTALDFRAFLRDSGAVVAIVDASTEPALEEVRGELDALRELVVIGNPKVGQQSFAELIAAATPARAADTRTIDPALIMYTARSGREAKGVLHTHGAPLRAFSAYGSAVLGLGLDDRVFSVSKLASSYGLAAGLVFPLAAGAQALLLPAQPRTMAIADVIQRLSPTMMFATPSQYSQLLEDASVQGGFIALAGLRACVSGTEALPPTLAARVKARFGVDILAGYGLSESFFFVIANQPDRIRAGSAGEVLGGFESRIVDAEGTPVDPGEIGTLEIAGPSLAKGYWNRPAESAAAFVDGWLRTGDRFFCDEEGFYVHCGRVDDLFKVGGKWVSPQEIESTLLAHGAVWECAVIGVDDENGLPKPLAFVVVNVDQMPGPELESELMAFVKREIAPYKYPRWIEFVNELPKGDSGSVLRYKLIAKSRKRRAPSERPE